MANVHNYLQPNVMKKMSAIHSRVTDNLEEQARKYLRRLI